MASFPDVWGSSEAREAHIVALMAGGADLILPLRNGLVPSKPPLFHWFGAAIASVLPVDPITAARLVSVIAGTVVLVQVWLLTLRLAALAAPQDRELQRLSAWGAVACLITSYGFVTMVTDARVDMCFAALVISAVVALIGAVQPQELRSGTDAEIEARRFSYFFIFSGLAVVAKGPLGIVLPILIGGVWYLATRGFNRTISTFLRPRIGWLLFILIALPWYVAAASRGGDGFVGRQIIFENIQRMLGGDFVNAQPWYFYGQVVLLSTLPWSLVFIWSSLGFVLQRRWQGAQEAGSGAWSGARQVQIFLMGWFWLGVFLFSLASGKRPAYLLPLLPAVAIFVSLQGTSALFRGSSKQQGRIYMISRLFLGLLITIGVGLVGLLAVINVPGGAAMLGSHMPELPFGVSGRLRALQSMVGLTLVVVLLILYRRRRLVGEATLTLTLMLVFGLWFALMSSITALSWTFKGVFKGFPEMAEKINGETSEHSVVSVVRDPRDEYFDPLLYYLGREVKLHPPEQKVLQCPGFTLARRSWVDALPAEQMSKATVALKTAEWRLVQSGAEIHPERELYLLKCSD